MSDKIQRWALGMGLDLVESDRGSWCKYYDVAPLEQQIAEQADELKIAEQGRIALRSKITEQAEEIERLEAALRSQRDECERFHKPA